MTAGNVYRCDFVWVGQWCGSVGGAVASDTSDMQFKRRPANFIYYQLY